MAAVVVDAYKQNLMGYLVGIGTIPTLTCHLFTNTLVTFGDSTSSGLTEPSGGTGYSSQAVPYTSWTPSTVSDVGQVLSNTITFNFTGAVTFYGYWLSDGNNSNAYVAGETLASSVIFGGAGGSYQLTITLKCGDS